MSSQVLGLIWCKYGLVIPLEDLWNGPRSKGVTTSNHQLFSQKLGMLFALDLADLPVSLMFMVLYEDCTKYDLHLFTPATQFIYSEASSQFFTSLHIVGLGAPRLMSHGGFVKLLTLNLSEALC